MALQRRFNPDLMINTDTGAVLVEMNGTLGDVTLDTAAITGTGDDARTLFDLHTILGTLATTANQASMLDVFVNGSGQSLFKPTSGTSASAFLTSFGYSPIVDSGGYSMFGDSSNNSVFKDSVGYSVFRNSSGYGAFFDSGGNPYLGNPSNGGFLGDNFSGSYFKDSFRSVFKTTTGYSVFTDSGGNSLFGDSMYSYFGESSYGSHFKDISRSVFKTMSGNSAFVDSGGNSFLGNSMGSYLGDGLNGSHFVAASRSVFKDSSNYSVFTTSSGTNVFQNRPLSSPTLNLANETALTTASAMFGHDGTQVLPARLQPTTQSLRTVPASGLPTLGTHAAATDDTYSTVVTLPGDGKTRHFTRLSVETQGMVVSFDGGTTDHIYVTPGETVNIEGLDIPAGATIAAKNAVAGQNYTNARISAW